MYALEHKMPTRIGYTEYFAKIIIPNLLLVWIYPLLFHFCHFAFVLFMLMSENC